MRPPAGVHAPPGGLVDNGRQASPNGLAPIVRGRPSIAQGGFTFLWVLAAIAVLGIGLLAVSEVWETTARRQKLVQLEWCGEQFRQAIGSYYSATQSPDKAFPSSLQDLLEDRRYGLVRRHLREIYSNPFTGHADWETIAGPDGLIHGVRANVQGIADPGQREFVFKP